MQLRELHEYCSRRGWRLADEYVDRVSGTKERRQALDRLFRILFVFVVLAHPRRPVIHFNVTAHPTSEWTAQQIAEAFPWDTAPRYLLHDRDSIY